MAKSSTIECYCGRELAESTVNGFVTIYRHATGDPLYCYEEESHLDDESRCTAMKPEDFS